VIGREVHVGARISECRDGNMGLVMGRRLVESGRDGASFRFEGHHIRVAKCRLI
jgi:hypothetical protein